MAPANPQQPGLRAFIVYDEAPAGLVPFLVPDDRMAPHLRAGDVALIDPTDTQPMAGELFVIRWSSGARQVVEVAECPAPETIVGFDPAERYWSVGWTMAMVSAAGDGATPMQWGDGPFYHAGLTKKLAGRVVGILEPTFAEPTLLAAREG